MRHGRYLVVLAGIGLAAAGCGTVTAQTASLTTAVTNTTTQTSQVAVTTTVQTRGTSMSFTETGQFDFAHSRGTVSMRSPIGATEIILPPKVYIRVPVGSGTLPHGKSWIAIDTGVSAGDSPAGMNVLLGGLGSEGVNPAELLASLTAISGNVTKLGAATVRGVPVTEFRVNVDLAKAAARLPGWERAGFRDFASNLGTGDIPVDVWVKGNDPAAVARTVMPAQRSCASSVGNGPKITVKSFRITSAQPAGTGRATVRFTVQAQASLDGQNVPVFPRGRGNVQWLVAAESGSHWYVDLATSSDGVFGGACS